VIDDLAADPRAESWRSEAAARGYASGATFPLVHQGHFLGVVVAFSPERGAFTDDVIDLLRRLADDVAFGLAALRSREEADQASMEVRLACDLARPEVSRFELGTGAPEVPGPGGVTREPLAGLAGRAAGQILRRLHPDDLATVEALLAGAKVSTPATPDLAPGRLLRIITGEGGLRWVDTRGRVVFDDRGAPMSVIAASQDVTARVEEGERLRALTARVLSIREEESARIARDLHDDLGQLLTALQIEIRSAERAEERVSAGMERGGVLDHLVEAGRIAALCIKATQRISVDLRPEALDHLGLCAALAQQARAVRERTGLEVVTELAVEPEPTGEQAIALFRIAQEALTNVVRHAGARRVTLALGRLDGWLQLTVHDDGRGLPEEAPGGRDIGLIGMQERARALGGLVAFERPAGGGTVVRARVPYAPGSGPALRGAPASG